MTTTDTRIAELLGWEKAPLPGGYWESPRQLSRSNFTTDLNLTVREIERKGWAFDLEWQSNSTYLGSIYDGVRPLCVRIALYKGTTASETLALAFLDALEAQKREK